MKSIKTVIAAILCTTFLFCVTSCAVFLETKHDNGHHYGWYKNPHNPHHHNSTISFKVKGEPKHYQKNNNGNNGNNGNNKGKKNGKHK
jgi:hypothetical protein